MTERRLMAGFVPVVCHGGQEVEASTAAFLVDAELDRILIPHKLADCFMVRDVLLGDRTLVIAWADGTQATEIHGSTFAPDAILDLGRPLIAKGERVRMRVVNLAGGAMTFQCALLVVAREPVPATT